MKHLSTHQKLSPYIVYGICFICCLPFLCNLLGIDFGSHSQEFSWQESASMDAKERIDGIFYYIPGAFTHTILEWTAVCVALLTVILAFSNFNLRHNDISIQVICIALFCSGCMDAFHTLAADRLINAVADNKDLIPFTWALSRTFNAFIMMIGVGIFFLKKPSINQKKNMTFILLVSLFFGIVSYVLIYFAAGSENLPQTQFKENPVWGVITRPYDAFPLVIFILSGLVFYPLFYKKYPGIFSHALLLSAVPEVVTQLHMAFGSDTLFDNHFNIAHFMKMIAYIVPFIGLSIDYGHVYRQNHARTNTILSAIPDTILVFNREQKLSKIGDNNTIFARKQLASAQTEIAIGQSITELIPRDVITTFRNNIQKAFETNQMQEFEFQLKDGDILEYYEARALAGKEEIVISIRDISRRKKETETLRLYSEKLLHSNAELERFAYVASHDLQEPIRSITGFMQLLDKGYSKDLDEKARHYINRSISGAQRLQNLVQALLEYSRINTVEKTLEDVNCLTVLQQVSADLEASITESSAKIEYDTLPVIFGDHDLLKRLFQNLISNAITFNTQEIPMIKINSETKDGSWLFSVEDNGIGIDPKYFERIFVIFQRLHRQAEYPGTGIGLSICKKIVEVHGGQMWCKSQSGQGTTFYFSIPIPKKETQEKND